MPTQLPEIQGEQQWAGPAWRATRVDHQWVVEHLRQGVRPVIASVLVSLGAAVSGAVLVAVTPSSLELVTWPLAALLELVALLGLPAALRRFMRARRGVRLVVSVREVKGQWVPQGLGYDMLAREHTVGASSVTEVLVRRLPQGALMLHSLEVVLSDGRRFEGPEVATEPHSERSLEPLARALAQTLQRPFRLLDVTAQP